LDGTGPVESFSLDELRQFRYADGQGIQTLEEFFEQVGKRIKPMLEIKSRGCSGLVIDLVHRYGYGPKDILIQSFDRGDIAACHALDPSLTYGLCIGGLGKFPVCRHFLAALFLRLRVGNAPVTWLNLDGPFIYDEFIDVAHRRGLHIILGAKNPENYLDKLDRWGVEIINADDGVALRAALDEFHLPS
jgi:glycerophosphoryl diester phosphodiesterase